MRRFLEPFVPAAIRAAANRNSKDKEYWKQTLSGYKETSNFAAEEPAAAANMSRRWETLPVDQDFNFSPKIVTRLIQLTQSNDYALHIYFTASVILLFHRYSGSEDLLVITPVYKQQSEGELINRAIPLRIVLHRQMTFKELLSQVKQTIVEAVAHQNFPLEMLLELPELANSTLFDTAVVMENIQAPGNLDQIRPTITFSFSRQDHTLEGKIRYNPQLYKRSFIAGLSDNLELLLSEVLFNMDRPLQYLELPVKVKNRVKEQEKEPGIQASNDTVTVTLIGDTPRDYEIREKLAVIWREILEKETIRIDDNFFASGGHSLRAMILASRIQKEFKVEIPLTAVFRNRTLREMATYIGQAGKSKYEDIQPVEKREYYPLSSAQKRLYFLQQMNPAGTGYNIPLQLHLEKEIDKNKLEAAVEKLIARHESLRTSFINVNNEPVQRIHDFLATDGHGQTRTKQDLSKVFAGGYGGQFLQKAPPCPEAIIKNFIQPFDLTQAPLLRSTLVELPGQGYTWLLDIHHIISDGTSHAVLAGDFMALYNEEALEPLRLHYKDFSQWQQKLFTGGAIQAQEKYWLELFSGEIPRLDWPTDFKRPAIFTFAGAHYSFILAGEEVFKSRRLAANNGGTLYMNILAAANVLLYRYTGQTDIIIGSGTAGRPHVDLQRIIGMFVNMLAMRNYPRGEKRYELFLKEIIAASVRAFENQDVQFEELVDRLNLERDPSRNPLFDISMVVQNYQRGEADAGNEWAGNKQITPEEYQNPTSKFDLTFFVRERGDELEITIEYYTGIFKAETISRLAGHFKNILKEVNRNPYARLKDIDMLPAEEKELLLVTFNETAGATPGEKNLYQLVVGQIERTPDQVALVVPGGKGKSLESLQITYRELLEKVASLAYYLQNKGLKPEEPVGILISQAQYCALAILAILKAGGAYVPLDPQLPQERLKGMIDDTGLGIIISEKRYINQLNRLQWECPGFHTYLCTDSYAVSREEETEKSELMAPELWHHVGETATDEIEGGGWKSSYTGEPFSKAEMDEYGDNILEKLHPLLHPRMRVLEIGCASGISMFRIAPHVGLYYGTDLSQVIIEKNKQRVASESHKNIKLMCVPAHEIRKIEENAFDLVIMNSVIQCFHGHNYLLSIIREAVRLLGDRGYLFIGDVMDLDKKEILARELQAFKYDETNRDKGYTTKTDLSAELFLPRSYWNDLESTVSGIQSIQVSDKIHTLENELTRFRYDVSISVDKTHSHRKKQRKQKYQEDINDLIKPKPGPPIKPPEVLSKHLAYIIYTSGSTGQPRGVQVEHRGVVNMLSYRKELYGLDPNCVCLQLFSYAFDGYVTGFFTPLISGARLVMPDKEETGDVEKIKEAIVKSGVTHFISVPALYSALIGGLTMVEAASLKAVTLAGDNIHPELLEMTAAKNKNLEIINEYGVTESSVMSTAHRHQEQDKTVKIGRPIRNTCIYILDQGQGLQPLVAAGELCIAGMGLARGYLNNPELTRGKFIYYSSHMPHTSDMTYKLYKSGDLARWQPDGNIEFLGRIDHQVKIRGYRIELGEIDSSLSKHPAIKTAVVVIREQTSGDRHIWAYLEPREGTANTGMGVNEWRGYLAQRLPAYMIPSYFIVLEKMPLNPSGKIDRRALLKMSAPDQREGFSPPQGMVEEKLAAIWAQVLDKHEAIGRDDNFFRLGGHSLKATILTTKIFQALQVKVPLAEVFKTPTIKGLAAYIQRAETETYKTIDAVEKKEYYPLSSSQKRLYFLYLLKAEGTAYNMPLVMVCGANPDGNKLEEIFKALVQRHESLRTSFEVIDGEPVQRIHHFLATDLHRQSRTGQDLSKVFGSTFFQKGGTPEAIIKAFIRPFDLSLAPLLRVGLAPLENGETLFMLDLHHIISDGTSQAILLKEFTSLYNNSGSGLDPLRIHYKDYACWRNRWTEKEREKQRESYWLEQLSGELPILALPYDNPRPPVKSTEGTALNFTFHDALTRELKNLAVGTGATLFMVLYSLFYVLLAKLSGQEDIVIGTPTAGRKHPDIEPVVGFFINTLAIRSCPTHGKPYREFLEEFKTTILQAFENQEYPLEELVERVVKNRDESRNPLFDVMFVFQNLDIPVVDIPGLTMKPYPFKNRTAKFDLAITATEVGQRLEITLEYCTALFNEQTIKRYFTYLKTAAEAVIKNSAIRLKEIGIVPEEEKERILVSFNETAESYPSEKCIHELFAEQAGRTPGYVAITAGGQGTGELISLTYNELNARADRQARELQSKGVQPDTIVGLMMPPTLDMIICLLGILKAGGAYLPIDPVYPEERIYYILQDSSAQLLITHVTQSQTPAENAPDKSFMSYIPPSSTLAYVIYTSGSTGKPKGVLIEHHGIVNFTCWRLRTYNYTRKDVTLQILSFVFDGFGSNLYSSLLSGGVLLMIHGINKLDTLLIKRAIRQNHVTNMSVVPNMYQVILDNARTGELSSLRFVVLAGEKSSSKLVQESNNKVPSALIFNEYGPTEASVGATRHSNLNEFNTAIIGKPIDNTSIYILNTFLKPVPIGIPGELCIAGVGLARGYLNNPELTHAKFILYLNRYHWSHKTHKSYITYMTNKLYKTGAPPAGGAYKNSVLYRTGDLARWLEDGTIEYLGRIDTQVKVRGYRIETGEIEKRLLNHPAVKEAVVITRENAAGERDLWAYFVPKPGSPGKKVTTEELRNFLSTKLPDYMCPSYYISLELIPLTPNGKIDRQALPGPEALSGDQQEKPADEIEETLTRLWAEVLGIEPKIIGTGANFFSLGGHSLRAVRLISRVQRTFRVEMAMSELFHAPTIKEMAAYIRKTVPTGYLTLQPREQKEYYPLSSAQQRLYFLQHLDPAGTGYNIPNILLLEGELDKKRLEDCFRQLIGRHEILRTSFEMAAGTAVQRVNAEVKFTIEYVSTTDRNESTETGQNQSKVFTGGYGGRFFQKEPPIPPEAYIKSFIQPFDLSQAPLIRVGLLPLQKTQHLFIVDLHHIIADAFSIGILIKELSLIWGNHPLPLLPLRYTDFAQWQNNLKNSSSLKKQAEYWWKELSGELPVLELPTDNPRPPIQSFAGDRLPFTIEAAETAALKALAQTDGTTIFMVLLALFNVLLAKLSRQEDIIVGTPVAGRRHVDLEHIIGMFVDTLVLRNSPVSEKSFRDFLQEVKNTTISAFENQDYQYADLVEKLTPQLTRETNRNPLFDAMMSFQNVDIAAVEIPGLKVQPYRHEMPVSKFDLTLDGAETGETLSMSLEFSTALFKKETITRWITYFKNIISSAVHDFDTKIMAMEPLPAEERKQILNVFNNPRPETIENITLFRMFSRQVEQNPDRLALVGRIAEKEKPGSDIQLTYGKVKAEAGRLAETLRQKGVRPDSIVAIMMERSLEMIADLLGILEAGGAYMPIDPTYPEERIQFILKDSGSKILVTDREKNRQDKIEIVGNRLTRSACSEDRAIRNPQLATNPSKLAYVIYTSGTTGRPKGVAVEHRNAAAYIQAFNKEFNLSEEDVFLQQASISFDASVEEIFPVLVRGGRLAVSHPDMLLDVPWLAQFLVRHRVTMISCSPLLLSEMNKLEYLEKTSIRIFISGGDVLKGSYITRLCSRGRVYNTYGPTETTVCAAYYRCEAGISPDSPIPIGKPITGYTLYILDTHNRLQPVGIPGELCIGGVGVTRGYLNNPELTGEKFMFYRSYMSYMTYKLYKTGDLARWQPDGNIEFLGRIDHQVKIRGYRIELGEIERQLSQFNGIKETVVTVKESGHQYLCAYITASDKNISLPPQDIKDYLSKKLPAYMIPAFFVQMEKIPLTPSGKVNRRLLPEPETSGLSDIYEAPVNEIEQRLVEVWTEVLTPGSTNPSIGTGANFFDLGGDSIKAIQVSSRLRKYGLELKINHLFSHPVIKDLSRYVKKIRRHIPQHEVTGEVPLTPIQHWYFETHTAAPHHFNHAVMLYKENGFNEKIVEKVFTEILRHHDALRMVYRFNSNEPGEPGEHKNQNKIAVRQECRGTDGKLFDFDVFNFQDEADTPAEILERANRIQAGMDLERGPLVKLGLFKTPGGDHLLIVIHHLVIDGVSWRIVFEDFTAGYRQAEQGKTIILPEKTDSFRHWSRELYRYAEGTQGTKGNTPAKEAAYWRKLEANAPEPLHNKTKIPPDQKKRKHTAAVMVELEPAETALLLKKVNRTYNTEINDILLTALGMAIHRWAGLDTVAIHLEGHGREPIIEDMEIGRTVGWYTSQYPVVLEMTGVNEPGTALKTVKETLRRIPNKGIGYDILKYLAPPSLKTGLTFKLEPEIAFNYLGEIGLGDARPEQPGVEYHKEKKNEGMTFSPLAVGESSSPEMEQTHTLSINGMVTAGKLTLSLAYNRLEYEESSIRQLTSEFKDHLLNLIRHCTQKQERELTPSDVTDPRYVDISLEEFSRLSRYLDDHIPGNPAIKAVYPLSPMQEGMLYHALAVPGKDVYFTQTLFQLEGDIDKEVLAAAFNTLIQRYDILRTIFIHEGLKEPLQVVLDHFQVEVDENDLTSLPPAEQILYLEEALEKDKQRGFSLNKDILMRLLLFRQGKKKHSLLWSFHHILMDGWCLGIIYKELVHIYGQLKKNRPITLAEPAPYKDYIYWQAAQDKTAGYSYWDKYLAGYEQQAGIPRSLTGETPQKTWETEPSTTREILVALSTEETLGINHLAGANRVTVNTLFQALWGILLQIYNNCDDVVFGAVVSGRPPEIPGIEHMVGLFINTIPVRIKSGIHQSFTQLLRNLQEDSTSSKSFEYLPLAEIQSRTPLKGNLFHHIMIYENYPLHREVGLNSKRGNTVDTEFNVTAIKAEEKTNYDFNIVILPSTPLVIKFAYNESEYDIEVMERMKTHFQELINLVLRVPDLKISEIEILTEQERKMVLSEFNRAGAGNPIEKTLHRLFTEQVEITPDQIALVGILPLTKNVSPLTAAPYGRLDFYNEVQLSYRQLDKKSDIRAEMMRKKGVAANSIVAIMVTRGLEMITWILGILKAGGAYLPIDPEYPQERIHYMLKDSAAKIVITAGEDASKQKGINEKIVNYQQMNNVGNQLACSEDPAARSPQPSPQPAATSSNLAYVIYTSGSTGRPKGVLVEHRNVARLFHSTNFFNASTGHRLLLTGAPVFDISVFEIGYPLLNGLTLFIADLEVLLEPAALGSYITGKRISILHLTPQLFNRLAVQSIEIFRGLSYFLVGGDLVQPEFINRLHQAYPHLRILHMYGPTENAIFSTFFPVEKETGNRIPIGKPVSQTQVYILDKYHRVQPVGIPGELVVGGVGVSRGYLNNPEQTREKFMFYRYYMSYMTYKLYRTGDLARWQPDGNIEFMGRVDHQVKIRGYRIELGEIERQLSEHPRVKAAVVTSNQGKDGDRYLCAYIVGEDNSMEPGFAEIKEFLAKKLPVYMVPAYVVKIDAIPLNPNGKLDRARLPEPEAVDLKPYLPPQTSIEKELAHLYAELLRVDREKISRRTDFMAAGGHSLQVIRLSAKIAEVFGAQIPVTHILKHGELHDLANLITGSRLLNSGEEICLTFNPGKATTIFCFPPIVGYGISYMEFAAAMKEYTVIAFNYIDDPEKITIYADKIVEMQPLGPYVLMGYSSGGIMSWKTAELLEERGYNVSKLLLIDCYIPENEWEIREADSRVLEEQISKLLQLAGDYLEQLGAVAMTEKVHATIRDYDTYINGIREYGPLNAGIHLVKVEYEKTLAKLGPPIWERLARNRYVVHHGSGSHDRMLGEEFLGENVIIIKQILALPPDEASTPINQKLLQGVQGDGFLEKSPPGRRRQ